jgi:hypothetical protein
LGDLGSSLLEIKGMLLEALNGYYCICDTLKTLCPQDLPIRNLIDVMHVERNVCENLLGFLFGSKDTAAVRRDLEEQDIRPHLHIHQRGVEGDNYVKPPAPYVLTADEQRQFLEQVASISVPTGYSANLKKHIIKKKLGSMKSHDFHIMLQYILPVCLRHLMHPSPRQAIIMLGRLFEQLCLKVINTDPRAMHELKTFAAGTMCLLEIWFPPAFFDISVHLVIHLVDQMEICGPVSNCWCYPLERYMSVMKSFVRTRARPEAAIANGYSYYESLGFCSEYFQLQDMMLRKVWDDAEEPEDAGEVLLGGSTPKLLSIRERHMIHSWIIRNSVATANAFRYVNVT